MYERQIQLAETKINHGSAAMLQVIVDEIEANGRCLLPDSELAIRIGVDSRTVQRRRTKLIEGHFIKVLKRFAEDGASLPSEIVIQSVEEDEREH